MCKPIALGKTRVPSPVIHFNIAFIRQSEPSDCGKWFCEVVFRANSANPQFVESVFLKPFFGRIVPAKQPQINIINDLDNPCNIKPILDLNPRLLYI